MNLPEVFHVSGVVRGFTLIELLLVTSIMTIVGVFVVPVAFSAYESQVLAETVDGITGALRRAEGFALAGRHGASFGVHFSEGAYTLFEGESFGVRSPEADETYAVPQSITVNAAGDVLFAAATGEPSGVETVTVSSDHNTSSITIHATGLIE